MSDAPSRRQSPNMNVSTRKLSFIAVACLAAASAARAEDDDEVQGAQIEMNVPGAGSMNIRVQGGPVKTQTQTQTQHSEVIESSGPGYKVRYETNPQGDTLVRVLAPEGFTADIWDGGNRIAH